MPYTEINYDALSEAIQRMESARVSHQERPRDAATGRFTRTFVPRCGEDGCTSCPDRDGYGRDGFHSLTGQHRNGTPYDADGYDYAGRDADGYDRNGFNYYGMDRDGYNRAGFDDYGFDRDGYNINGFNRTGRHRNGSLRDDEGYDRNGLSRAGYDRNGYDQYGFNEDGRNAYGYDRDGYDEDGYDEDGYDSDGQNRYGEYRDDDEPDGRLHNYSYTPRLQFRGDGAPWFGMEIEVTSDRIRRLVNTVEEHAGNLVYCKEDGSVAGAELVTHPMSYDWAMANFPWQMLPALKNEADATIVQSDNGIHIHVSRDGFTNASHTYRWMKFWYRNPRDIQRIARRASSSWGDFRPETRKGQFEHCKMGKPSYDYAADSTRRHRYSAINTQNDATLEVRVFASTLRPQRAQAALQLVAATLEYTRQLTADDICHRHGWDWSAFMAWTRKSGQYGALVAEDRIRRYL